MNDVMLAAYKATKTYRSGARQVRAVDGVDLFVKRCASLAILGPSGAGKSTLLHLLGGLDSPTSGSVLLDGLDIYSLSDKERARARNKRVGFIFQFYHLLPEFTAFENVMMPALMSRSFKRSDLHQVKQRAGEVLASVGLSNRLSHRPGELSGGESQRVAIARAMINEPEVLMCDEPTGNLDSKSSHIIYDLLFELKARSNTALVIVTHDESLASRTDETIRIKDGKVVPQ